MGNTEIDVAGLPEERRAAFGEFAGMLTALAGENLLGLCGFGGWVVEDPAYVQAPARSVLVLRRCDLPMLDQLGARGGRFRRKNIAAPLVMTPEYIQASCDVFPLELLEIQQLQRRVCGEDYFSKLTFAPGDLRLQCERELKSELIQLRQGLIAATGHHKLLHDACVAAAERCIRVVRGILHLASKEVPLFARDVLTAAAEVTGLRLVTLARALAGADRLDFDRFQRCYAEVEALAAYVDELDQT
jgi:hypothetical protein